MGLQATTRSPAALQPLARARVMCLYVGWVVPSFILPIYMNVLALASPSGVTAVAFRFKAEGLQKDETLSVSSLYVDPLKMG